MNDSVRALIISIVILGIIIFIIIDTMLTEAKLLYIYKYSKSLT